MAHIVAGSPFYVVILIILSSFLDIPSAWRALLLAVPIVAFVCVAALIGPQWYLTSLVVSPILLGGGLMLWSRRKEKSAEWWRIRRKKLRRKRKPLTEKTKRILGRPNPAFNRRSQDRFLEPMRRAKAPAKWSRIIIYD
jgi:hypothetical protein